MADIVCSVVLGSMGLEGRVGMGLGGTSIGLGFLSTGVAPGEEESLMIWPYYVNIIIIFN